MTWPVTAWHSFASHKLSVNSLSEHVADRYTHPHHQISRQAAQPVADVIDDADGRPGASRRVGRQSRQAGRHECGATAG